MNYKALYTAYKKFFENKEFKVSELRGEEHDILHWARMNVIKRLDIDVWYVENYFDFSNIMYTYHIDNFDSIIYNYNLPLIVSFTDDIHWYTSVRDIAKIRFEFTIKEFVMSIKNSWVVESEGVWSKNGFTVTEDEEKTEIHVWFKSAEMKKPWSSVEQAMYWCEGRML